MWCSDIPYLPLSSGFVYLVAVMDWFSRYVLAWRISNTLDAASSGRTRPSTTRPPVMSTIRRLGDDGRARRQAAGAASPTDQELKS